MSRITTSRYDKIELDREIDGVETYTPVEITSGNKFGIRFPPGSIYSLDTTDDMHLAITLKIERR